MKTKTEPKAAGNAPVAPFSALLQAGAGCMSTPAQFAECWQRQLNTNLRIFDAALGSAARLRDAQMPAAGEFLARAAELQKSMLEARSPLELWTVQCNWMMEGATRAMALWKGVFDAASEASANFCGCLREEAQEAAAAGARVLDQASVIAPAGSLATQDLVKTALVSFDAAYGQMLKGSQQMMAAATGAMSGQSAPAAASKPPAKRGAT